MVVVVVADRVELLVLEGVAVELLELLFEGVAVELLELLFKGVAVERRTLSVLTLSSNSLFVYFGGTTTFTYTF